LQGTDKVQVRQGLTGIPFDSLHDGLATALGSIGPQVIPFLYPALKHKDRLVRAGAALAFIDLAVYSETPRPVLEEAATRVSRLLRDKEPFVRERAARVLGHMGSYASATVPAMTKALEDSDPRVRVGVASTLGGIGRKAAPAIPALTARLKDKSPDVRRAAKWALKEIVPPRGR